MELVRCLGAIAIAAALLGCSTAPTVKDLSYQEASQRAAEHSDPTYEAEVRPELGKWMIGGIMSCKFPEDQNLALVVAIGADGRPDAVYVDPLTPATRCVQRHVRGKARFSKPPFAPFFTTPAKPF
jgi:hypothetical protein